MNPTICLPRFPLLSGETPLERKERLAVSLGLPGLFMKRDDCTGIGLGGNKLRKLEFLLADALAQKADTVITTGGTQSNHTRLTAAAARKAGLAAELVLRTEQPDVPAGSIPVQGNILISRILGAKLHFTYAPDPKDWEQAMQEVAAACEKQGKKPYIIPSGGANPLGCVGYFLAGSELAEQCRREGLAPEAVVTACGSTGTLAGLLTAKKYWKLPWRLIGISVGNDRRTALEKTLWLAEQCAKLLHLSAEFQEEDVEIYDDYRGEGYAKPSRQDWKAIRTAAQLEGVLLDPVYTGRAFGGLMDLADRKRVGRQGPVVFFHTGGTPAAFAFSEAFRQGLSI